MGQVDPLHAEITAIALRAAVEHGFALGGGNALVAHGVVSRPTRDIDLFTNADTGIPDAARRIFAAFQTAGIDVAQVEETSDMADLFYGWEQEMVEFEIRRNNQVVRLSLSQLSRRQQPVMMEIGPVLHLDDLIASKVAALGVRGELRDYIDTAAFLGSGRTVDQLIAAARAIDPALTDEEFAAAGRRLDKLPDDAFTPYGLTAADVASLRQRFVDWPRTFPR
jgi:hypothetical protein